MEIRKIFHSDLQKIQNDILIMGSMVEKAIGWSMESLKSRKLDLAHEVIRHDTQIDNIRFAIEEKCIKLIATQQPMASDLRIIISTLHIASELERIGDHAEGIAKISIMIGDEPLAKPLTIMPVMAEKTQGMLRSSLDALVKRDVILAKQICADDDEIDTLYDAVFNELVGIVVNDKKMLEGVTRLIWVAHNLERSADRVTNICERIVYIVTGKMEEIGVSKY